MAYSQFKAMLAITKASLTTIRRSPSSIIFSIVFPFVFILVFGFIGGGNGMQAISVVLDKKADTNNILYQSVKASEVFRFKNYDTEEALKIAQQKGRIAGILNIVKSKDSSYAFQIKSTSASSDKWPQLRTFLQSIATSINEKAFPAAPKLALVDFDFKRDIAEIRAYKTIDFILPGQIGFSLLGAGVFGVAFTFFNLRNQLILKRFFATPISKMHIILGECLSRVIFQMLTAVVIILAGHYLFGFTLVNGWVTFIEMLVLSFLGLIVFMGFGFVISGIAKNDSTIPPVANLIIMPQFILGGTFFSTDAFPKWLQPISNSLPLTHLNNAMRSIAFEGQNLWDVKFQIGMLLIWAVVVYAVAVKAFKWEQ
jgi:ABC-2 type transport system permease protein